MIDAEEFRRLSGPASSIGRIPIPEVSAERLRDMVEDLEEVIANAPDDRKQIGLRETLRQMREQLREMSEPAEGDSLPEDTER